VTVLLQRHEPATDYKTTHLSAEALGVFYAITEVPNGNWIVTAAVPNPDTEMGITMLPAVVAKSLDEAKAIAQGWADSGELPSRRRNP
jgi:hypothetical protein